MFIMFRKNKLYSMKSCFRLRFSCVYRYFFKFIRVYLFVDMSLEVGSSGVL